MPRKEGRLPPVAVEKTREEHRVVTGFHKACRAVHRQLDFDELLPTKRNRFRERPPRISASAAVRFCIPAGNEIRRSRLARISR